MSMQKMFVANKALLVNHEGKMLFVCDAGISEDHKGGAGSWDLPGGRMDKEDRTLQEALARELKEELGVELDVSKAEILTASLWSIAGDDDRRVTAIIYLIRVDAEIQVVLSEEHSEFGWFHLSDVDWDTASPCLKQVLRVYQDRK